MRLAVAYLVRRRGVVYLITPRTGHVVVHGSRALDCRLVNAAAVSASSRHSRSIQQCNDFTFDCLMQ
jgi:hypothetical protein